MGLAVRDRTKAMAVQVKSLLRTFKGGLITERKRRLVVQVEGCSRCFISIKLDIECYKITRVHVGSYMGSVPVTK